MRITSKGQVTIPKKLRREEGLLPGAEVEFVRKDGLIVLRPRVDTKPSKRQAEIRAHLERWHGSIDPGWTTEKVMDLTRGDD